jgi:hypothetical protein
MTGVVSTGVIGGSPSIDTKALWAVESALSALRRQLAADLPASSFAAWWAPNNPFHSDNTYLLAVAVNPTHEDAARANDLISKLPNDYQTFPLYHVEWPTTGAI